MADIFISYAKKHAQLTEDLARDLEAKGFTTWWDTSLLPGDEFPEQIRKEIDAAQAVVVIWTEGSVASAWVRAEANCAYGLGKLITLHAAGLNLSQVPLPFNTLQSSPVTDRAKVFAALARRGVKPSGDVSFSQAQKIETAPLQTVDKATQPITDGGALAAAAQAQEWAQPKGTSDAGNLRLSAQHFAGTYYADLAQKRITELEDAEPVVLELENVVSGYGRTVILDRISLTVREGEAVSLLGRNGMGKTTTIRTIMGLLPARSGRIRFKGQDITQATPERISRLGIGYVPEGRGVFPTLSVYENLVMAARPGPWTLESVYAMFPQLYSRRNNMGNQLSGGEQQMLSIGRALMLNPSLIILDEATEGLAPLVQDGIWACLKKIKETGLSILVIDKDIAALLEIADRHYVIQKGAIRALRTTQELRTSREDIDRFLAL